jgi:hypothetical protein
MAKQPRKPAKKKDVIKTLSDEYGNLILCENNGARIILKLKLRSESRTRRIGVVNLGQKSIEIKRDSKKHLFRKNNSYGFNYQVLKDAKLFNSVRLKDESNEWLIPKDFILDNGSFLFFKEEGFERQIFVPIILIEGFKRTNKI